MGAPIQKGTQHGAWETSGPSIPPRQGSNFVLRRRATTRAGAKRQLGATRKSLASRVHAPSNILLPTPAAPNAHSESAPSAHVSKTELCARGQPEYSPSLVECGRGRSTSAQFCRRRRNFDRSRPKFGRPWVEYPNFRPMSVVIGPNHGQNGAPNFVRSRNNLIEVGQVDQCWSSSA